MHMKYAVVVAETQSINKAAEQLYVGQSALSRAIKELESGLGVVLFRRSAKGMFLTPDGELFVRNARKVLAFSSDGRANGVKKVSETEAELGDPALDELLTPYLHQQLVDEIELLDGAAEEFDLDKVLRGELSPVFFGSALTNFGVEPFLENFLRLTPTPLARVDSLTGEPC